MKASGLTVRVARKKSEALDICTYELVSVDGGELPVFSAGSHIDVTTPNGITRQYSLCNDAIERNLYLIAVLKDPAGRGGSRAMHELVAEGDILQISEPRNHFALVHGARRSLLLAGGIGITPILCMADRLAKVGEDFELHYCARSRERMAFYDRIADGSYAHRASFHFDDGDPAQRLQLDALLSKVQAGTHVYVCGPKGFMDAVLGKARSNGWPESQLHYEFFASDGQKLSSDSGFDVKLASSGEVVSVPADKTIVQALAEAGVEVKTSCEQGVCGTCLLRVLDGEPDHRDLYLSTAERAANDQILPCCSRSKSPLLLLDL